LPCRSFSPRPRSRPRRRGSGERATA
jgi:hypothetical protein